MTRGNRCAGERVGGPPQALTIEPEPEPEPAQVHEHEDARPAGHCRGRTQPRMSASTAPFGTAARYFPSISFVTWLPA
jgi:hypothetical protein